MAKSIQCYIDMHDKIVKDILDKTDIPFIRVETFWFRKNQKHKYKGKDLIIDCDQDLLISSYIDLGGGKEIRISNHEKKNGVPKGMVEHIYNWENGKKIRDNIKTLDLI
jgi:hypothetical protein